MIKNCLIAICMVLFTFSVVFAQNTMTIEKNGDTWNCKKAVVQPLVKKPVITPQQRYIPAKKVVKKVEKKNEIIVEPMAFAMWSNGYHKPVFAPGVGLSYVRDLTSRFRLGAGAVFAYTMYGSIPHHSFNTVGGKLMFGIRFGDDHKNTIFVEPMLLGMHSNIYNKSVFAPGISVSYMRDVTSTFSFGGGDRKSVV